jgi:hypothetical protein
MTQQYFHIYDPQFGDTMVRANGSGEASNFYESYLRSIDASSNGRQGVTINQGVHSVPPGAHVVAGADRGDQGFIGFKLGTVSQAQPAGMWASNAQLPDAEYFIQLGFNGNGYPNGTGGGTGGDSGNTGSTGGKTGSDNPAGITDDPDPNALGHLEDADAIAGFLKGLGYDLPSTGGAANDFRYQQGALGLNTFAAQDAADFYRGVQDGTVGDQYKSPFGSVQDFGANTGGFTGIGTQALRNLETLSGLGKQAGVGYLGGTPGQQAFVNPGTADDLDRGGIQALLNAAFQGAGVSPLLLGRGGVSQGDIQQMFSQYAANTPGINVGAAGPSTDTNFLNYVAGQYGLNNFFNQPA